MESVSCYNAGRTNESEDQDMQCITSFDKNGRNEADTGLVFADVWDMPGTMFGSPASKKGEPYPNDQSLKADLLELEQ